MRALDVATHRKWSTSGRRLDFINIRRHNVRSGASRLSLVVNVVEAPVHSFHEKSVGFAGFFINRCRTVSMMGLIT